MRRKRKRSCCTATRKPKGLSYLNIAACEHSPDHTLLAYAVDLNGSEFFTIRIRDLATGETLPDTITSASGGFAWAADSRTLFYSVLDDNHRPIGVRRHVVGTDAAADPMVYKEADPGFFVGVGKTHSGRFIVIDAHDHETSEVHVIDADRPDGELRCIAPRETKVEYEVEHHGDRFLILTNAGGAEDFKLVEAPVDDPGRANWRDLVPHRPGRLIVGFDVFQDYLVRLERADALPHIIVTRFADDGTYEISFKEEAYSLGLGGSYEYATDTLRFAYSSMTTPEQTYDYDMATGDRVLRKEQEVPSGHDAADYVTRRIVATSYDGKPIPISLLYRKSTPIDGSAPVLLYGYGSYGITIPASFATTRLSLVDRGFIYAIAHIRGGMAGGLPLVCRRQDGAQEEHLPRLHLCRGEADRRRLRDGRELRRAWRQRRRHAGRRGREHAPRPVQGGRGGRAFRRRAQHDAGRDPAADAAGMGGMGQPDQGCRRLPLHPLLLAL